MKRHYLLIAAAIICVQYPLFGKESRLGNAECFKGFDVSVGPGYGGLTLITSRGGIKPSSHTSYGGDGVAVQLKLGGNCVFCRSVLFGLEGFGQYNSAETENRFFETVASTTETNRNFSMEWNLGLDLRLGLALRHSNLIFIYGGPDWGYYNFQYITTGVSSRYKQFELGGILGAGLEQKLRRHWTLRATFDYGWYPSKTIAYANGEQQTIKARLATTLFMLGYLF